MPSNNLIVLQGIAINGGWRPVSMLVDTGCSVSCMPYQHIQRLGLPTRRLKHPLTAIVADGSRHVVSHEAELIFRIGEYQSTLWLHESAGMLPSCDMLLGMDWMLGANPQICFSPLSIKVRGQDLADYMMKKRPVGRRNGDCGCPRQERPGNHGLGGYKRPSSYGARTKEEIQRELHAVLRAMGGHGLGGGYCDGHCGGPATRGFGHVSQPIPVCQHIEATDIEDLPCTCEDNAEQYCDDKDWINWRDLYPDIWWYKDDSEPKFVTQGSMIFEAPTIKAVDDEQVSSHDSVKAWLQKPITNDNDRSITKGDDSKSTMSTQATVSRSLKHDQVKLLSKQTSDKALTKAEIKSIADEFRDKPESLPQTHNHTKKDDKVTSSATASKTNTKRFLPPPVTKKGPDKYDLFH